MNHMPLMIDLSQKSIVIVGGGKVATKRASTLIEYCDDVHIVSPIISTTLKELLDNEMITEPKEFEPQDVEHADLVVIATNNNDVNTKVLESVPHYALCNHASKAQVGNVTIPSILKRGKLSISVSTNGASPKLNKKLFQE